MQPVSLKSSLEKFLLIFFTYKPLNLIFDCIYTFNPCSITSSITTFNPHSPPPFFSSLLSFHPSIYFPSLFFLPILYFLPFLLSPLFYFPPYFPATLIFLSFLLSCRLPCFHAVPLTFLCNLFSCHPYFLLPPYFRVPDFTFQLIFLSPYFPFLHNSISPSPLLPPFESRSL